MSDKLIPEHIDPFRYADQGLTIEGLVKIADMPRLGSAMASHEGLVTASLRFGVDEQGITFVKGHIQTSLTLACQRCLEPFIYEITSDFVLGIVNTLDEANALPTHYEPALAKEGQLALRELIEDELILNLPIIPKHEAEQCKVKLPLADAGWKKDEVDKTNPFHILKSFKHKQ